MTKKAETVVRKLGRPRAVDSVDTRVRLLAAARKCFGENGYEKTTNAQIAEVAGITTGAIYHYFPSKESILHALIDSFAKEVEILIQSASKYKLDQKKILTEFAEILLRHQDAVRLAPMLMPGAPDDVRDLLLHQHKVMLKEINKTRAVSTQENKSK